MTEMDIKKEVTLGSAFCQTLGHTRNHFPHNMALEDPPHKEVGREFSRCCQRG